MDVHLTKLSKFLSLILRHKPQVIGLTLDPAGWAAVDELIDRVNQHGIPITQGLLVQVVQTQPYLNFVFNGDRSLIRAVPQTAASVPSHLQSQAPPWHLFYPVGSRFIAAIRTQGLVAGTQLHVRLAVTEIVAHQLSTALQDGVIVRVAAQEMHQRGFPFFRWSDGVWLTPTVPPRYLHFCAQTREQSPTKAQGLTG